MDGSIHGGAFWQEVGSDLSKLAQVVRADVLDAWFPPAPSVISALSEQSEELCKTTPEAGATPLTQAISLARRVPSESVLTGGGSSALIFAALPRLAASSRAALILDPMYGEYRHVLENLCGHGVSTVRLSQHDEYRFDPVRMLGSPTDLIVIVNPNSPTGQHIRRVDLQPVVEELAKSKLVWIDETYIDYAGAGESLEGFASTNRNVIVCKSMSKVYALSGLRVGYLVSHPSRIAELAMFRPPWSVSLPAQVCASLALEDPAYYLIRYQETGELRAAMRRDLVSAGLDVTEGVINALLVHLPPGGPTAADVCSATAQQGIYLRDASSMGTTMGSQTLRVSVRNAKENDRVCEAIVRAVEHNYSASR